MNKQELIEKYEYMSHACFRRVDTLEVLKDLRRLDEPQKVTIPQFVADWIERSKQEKRNLRNALNNGGEKMRLWFLDQENYDLFARAWLDGYEVEKEKQYTVRMKGIAKANEVLNYKINEGKWVISSGVESTYYRTKHTRKELEDAGFGWVFDCEGIKIEEVTD